MANFTQRLNALVASGVREFDAALEDIASKERYIRSLDANRNWPGQNEVRGSVEQNKLDNRAAWNSTAREIRELYADATNANEYPIAILAAARQAIYAAIKAAN
jgi:hypothetical protein